MSRRGYTFSHFRYGFGRARGGAARAQLLGMKVVRNLRWLAACGVLGAVAGMAHAEDAPPAPTTPAPAVAPPAVLPPEHHWRLGLAAGYGMRTNPLIQSDDIPVIV